MSVCIDTCTSAQSDYCFDCHLLWWGISLFISQIGLLIINIKLSLQEKQTQQQQTFLQGKMSMCFQNTSRRAQLDVCSPDAFHLWNMFAVTIACTLLSFGLKSPLTPTRFPFTNYFCECLLKIAASVPSRIVNIPLRAGGRTHLWVWLTAMSSRELYCL